MSGQPAVARWYQACFEFPAMDRQRFLAVVFVVGQLAEYWTGVIDASVEDICNEARVGRNSTYEILRELEQAGLLVTIGRVGKGGPIRRQVAIDGRRPTVQTVVRQLDLSGDDRTAPPGSAGNDRTGQTPFRTAAVQPQHSNTASVNEGSSRSDGASGRKVSRRRDPNACPACEHVPCLPDCAAADFRRPRSRQAGAPARQAFTDARRKMGKGGSA